MTGDASRDIQTLTAARVSSCTFFLTVEKYDFIFQWIPSGSMNKTFVNIFHNELLFRIDDKSCFSLKSECDSNNFGLDCRERCSGHCKNNEPCDHVSGDCSNGCQDGYHGARCFNCKKLIITTKVMCKMLNRLFFSKLHLLILACTAGYYGKNCSFSCPPSCNWTCKHIDGKCSDCEAGRESHCSKGIFFFEIPQFVPFNLSEII